MVETGIIKAENARKTMISDGMFVSCVLKYLRRIDIPLLSRYVTWTEVGIALRSR